MRNRTLRRPRLFNRLAAATSAAVIGLTLVPMSAMGEDDPRIGLGAGFTDAEEAASNVVLLEHLEKAGAFQGAPNSLSLIHI